MAVGRKGKVMTDYIKREALEQRMYHEAFENDASYDERNPMAKWDSGLWIRYKLFENVLANIPPADVVERKRGEWLWDAKSKVFRCSECNHYPWRVNTCENDEIFTDLARTNAYRFCPTCGADMRAQTERHIDE